MCGRYYIAEDDQAEELRQIIDSINRKYNGDGAVKTSGEIFPSETVPVIATSKAQKIMPFAMEWGYSTADGNRLINARSETAAQKPTFMDGMLHRRCIIPASWYFEWNRSEKGKPKYADCSSVEAMNEENKVDFYSRDEAITDGYVPCKRCDP